MQMYANEQIGEWRASTNQLTLNDITWPGEQATPPRGRPAKETVRVVTLKEDPFVIYEPIDNQTGACPAHQYKIKLSPNNSI